jgi:hypothetical protein
LESWDLEGGVDETDATVTTGTQANVGHRWFKAHLPLPDHLPRQGFEVPELDGGRAGEPSLIP